MRRHDRECSDPAFQDEVFRTATEVFLALRNGDFPYCLPLNFVREGDHLYMHSAREGLKLECVRRDPHVAFSLTVDVRIDTERATTYYKSLCGTGLATIVEDEAEKAHALDILGERYAARCHRPAREADVRRVAILRIDIVSLSGKRCLPSGEMPHA